MLVGSFDLLFFVFWLQEAAEVPQSPADSTAPRACLAGVKGGEAKRTALSEEQDHKINNQLWSDRMR